MNFGTDSLHMRKHLTHTLLVSVGMLLPSPVIAQYLDRHENHGILQHPAAIASLSWAWSV